jgi:DNA-binding NtrC family response regulator
MISNHQTERHGIGMSNSGSSGGVNKETVLVIDDEPYLAKAASRLLRAMGYEVLTATEGCQAIEICRTRGKTIDIVLVDWLIQGSSSIDLVRQLRDIQAGIRVVLMSGYGKQESMDSFQDIRPASFVSKPFGYNELEAAIRMALHSGVTE